MANNHRGFGLTVGQSTASKPVALAPVVLAPAANAWQYAPLAYHPEIVAALMPPPENTGIFPAPPAISVEDMELGIDDPAPLEYTLTVTQAKIDRQIEIREEIRKVFSNVLASKTPIVFFIELGINYFPPLSWLTKKYTSQNASGKVRTVYYTTSFRVEKKFGTLNGEPVELFLVTNKCIEFQYIRYANGTGEWKSQIGSGVKCFYENKFPPDSTLGFVMELRLMLQTLITDNFTIQDSAQFPARSKEAVLITPFRLVRGSQTTVYEKYGFVPTCDLDQFADFRLFLGLLFVNQLSTETQNRINAILLSKGKAFDENGYVITTMNDIKLYDEIAEHPSMPAGERDLPRNLEESFDLSSRVLYEALFMYNIARGFFILEPGKDMVVQEGFLKYDSKAPSINVLRYVAGPDFVSSSILLHYARIEEEEAAKGGRRNAKKTRRHRK